MSQLTHLQAEVNLRTLRAPQAREALDNPVVLQRGEVRSITLTIPLLTDRNSYLVVRLPDEAVRGLLGHVRTLPTNERADFIRQWVMRNQRAIIEQHVRSGGRDRRFRYDVVPVQAQPRVAEATPRRVEPAPQPSPASAVPRREPAAPAATPRASEQPRRVIQPDSTLRPRAAPPVAAPLPLTAPPVAATRTPDVSAPQPTERPVAAPAPRARETEDYWQGGRGTRANPYRIRVLTRRASGEGINASQIEIPIQITNVGRFSISVTLNQISASRFDATYREMLALCRQGYLRTEEGRGGTVRLSGIPSASEMRRRLYEGLPPDMRSYAQTH